MQSFPSLPSNFLTNPLRDFLLKQSPKITRFFPATVQKLKLGNQKVKITNPISLTPYAGTVPCSAKCKFCCERLVRNNGELLPFQCAIEDGEYFQILKASLSQLSRIPTSFTMSGLEPTSNREWLIDCLRILRQHEQSNIGMVDSKYLYSNASGFALSSSGSRNRSRQRSTAIDLINSLVDWQPDRIDVSRHHYDPVVNQQIMQFRKGVQIQDQDVFQSTISDLKDLLPIRLDCVLQKDGIGDLDQCINYLNWAKKLGLKEVAFRSLAKLPTNSSLVRNQVFNYINNQQVPINQIVYQALKHRPKDWKLIQMKIGYYYYNLSLSYKNGMTATFEACDYDLLTKRQNSGIIYKLVLHPNGSLNASWDPTENILISKENVLSVTNPETFSTNRREHKFENVHRESN
ncbi:hypothetical protein M0813_05611 [Anaeramoeba flamelloides]|uniref:Radical SAM core domain-containing protein n=1 Tax=Anaeramoeba flamelloides TaxID=1746091 RepID=A0ABQ8XFW9_9EUKA|nr:hypothetical protein M0813_05611 [Anaeramoeba flamelloides]